MRNQNARRRVIHRTCRERCAASWEASNGFWIARDRARAQPSWRLWGHSQETGRLALAELEQRKEKVLGREESRPYRRVFLCFWGAQFLDTRVPLQLQGPA